MRPPSPPHSNVSAPGSGSDPGDAAAWRALRRAALGCARRDTIARARGARIYCAVLRFALAEAAAGAPRIPLNELWLLRERTGAAARAASVGLPWEGYAELELGLVWAECPALHPVTLEPEPAEPWEAALADLYRRAMVEFAGMYSLDVAGSEELPGWCPLSDDGS